jgi:hypothetical protein
VLLLHPLLTLEQVQVVEERAREELSRQIQVMASGFDVASLIQFAVLSLFYFALAPHSSEVCFLQAANEAQTQLGQMWSQQLERRWTTCHVMPCDV